MEFVYIIGAVIVFFVGKAIYDSINLKKKTCQKIKKNFGKLDNAETEESIQLIDSFFMHKREIDSDFYIDSITSNDLKLLDFYANTNCCKSQAGAEYYYYLLNTPCFDKDELAERERLIEFFSQNVDLRTEILYEISRIGRSKKKISMFSCIEMLDGLKRFDNALNVFSITGLIAGVALIFVNRVWGILFLVGMVIFNIYTYFKIKGDLQGYLYGVKKLCSMVKCSENIVKMNIPEISEYTEVLDVENKKLSGLKKGAFAIKSEVSGDFASILLEYINMLLHIDLITFNNSLKNAAKNKDALKLIYEKIGYFDTLINICNLRKACNTWCAPEVVDEKIIEFSNLYHPSLTDPVPASLSTGKSILLTGSNASGKSTFLKAVALNAVLAQTIHTCFAESFKGCFFKVYTSMALNDNIYNGESYYITEIKALKRIIDSDKDYTVLAFIDEVLRGTNTVERIASSSSALSSIVNKNVICFAATHDLELTRLLSDKYSNYHFEEQLNEEGQICFDYELKDGPSNTKNAIKLLISLGYEKEITDNAERMSEHFVKTGVWEK